MSSTPAGLEFEHAHYVNTTEEERRQVEFTNAQLLQRNAELKAQVAAIARYYETAAMAHASAHMLFYGLNVASCDAPKTTRFGSELVARHLKETLPTISEYDDVSTIASGDGSNTEDNTSIDGSIAAPTTVMLRNIPPEYTRADILELVDQEGFVGLYELVYAPVDFLTHLNHGYVFICFTMADDAARFQGHFDGFANWRVTSENICEAVWCESSRGIDDNIERYRNSPVMHESVPDAFKPILFANGERIPFPEPTKKIRAPRIRGGRKTVGDVDCSSC